VVFSQGFSVLGHEGIDQPQHGVPFALLFELAQWVGVREQGFD
jgi:hypothetical protein